MPVCWQVTLVRPVGSPHSSTCCCSTTSLQLPMGTGQPMCPLCNLTCKGGLVALQHVPNAAHTNWGIIVHHVTGARHAYRRIGRICTCFLSPSCRKQLSLPACCALCRECRTWRCQRWKCICVEHHSGQMLLSCAPLPLCCSWLMVLHARSAAKAWIPLLSVEQIRTVFHGLLTPLGKCLSPEKNVSMVPCHHTTARTSWSNMNSVHVWWTRASEGPFVTGMSRLK